MPKKIPEYTRRLRRKSQAQRENERRMMEQARMEDPNNRPPGERGYVDDIVLAPFGYQRHADEQENKDREGSEEPADGGDAPEDKE